MKPRPAHLAAVPDPAPEPMLTVEQLAARLQVSRGTIERAVAAGMPHLDVGRHRPDRRPKRSLRFSWPEVLAWIRSGGA